MTLSCTAEVMFLTSAGGHSHLPTSTGSWEPKLCRRPSNVQGIFNILAYILNPSAASFRSHQHCLSLKVNPPENLLPYSHMDSLQHSPEFLFEGWQEKLKIMSSATDLDISVFTYSPTEQEEIILCSVRV